MCECKYESYMSKVTSCKARHLSLKMARVPSSIWSALHSASGVWSTRETVRLSSCWYAAAAVAAAVAIAAARPEVPRSGAAVAAADARPLRVP